MPSIISSRCLVGCRAILICNIAPWLLTPGHRVVLVQPCHELLPRRPHASDFLIAQADKRAEKRKPSPHIEDDVESLEICNVRVLPFCILEVDGFDVSDEVVCSLCDEQRSTNHGVCRCLQQNRLARSPKIYIYINGEEERRKRKKKRTFLMREKSSPFSYAEHHWPTTYSTKPSQRGKWPTAQTRCNSLN